MPTLDELIAQERRKVTLNKATYECECRFYGKEIVDSGDKLECVKEYEYHSQIAELLEELKKRRSEDYGYMADICECIGYRKAIDDFVNACKEDILCQTFGLHQNGIERIAEQLKAGEGCKNPDVLKVELTEEDLLKVKEMMKNMPIGIISTQKVEISVEYIDEAIRNKAIDDFVNEANKRLIKVSTTKSPHTYLKAIGSNELKKLAEQLKAGGGENDNI